MTFNQQLIQKARKGEIAILNDGSVEELCNVCLEVDKNATHHMSIAANYVYLSNAGNGWQGLKLCNMPFHSVKDFFMPDTKEFSILGKTSIATASNEETITYRTYKVTRQQMKEIWEAAPIIARQSVRQDAEKMFSVFENEAEITGGDVAVIVKYFFKPYPDFLKSIFPSYFFIPEGEPVLVRDMDEQHWLIAISDGNGQAFTHLGDKPRKHNQIIPFTKNPPK